jgi:hypothetical protein
MILPALTQQDCRRTGGGGGSGTRRSEGRWPPRQATAACSLLIERAIAVCQASGARVVCCAALRCCSLLQSSRCPYKPEEKWSESAHWHRSLLSLRVNMNPTGGTDGMMIISDAAVCTTLCSFSLTEHVEKKRGKSRGEMLALLPHASGNKRLVVYRSCLTRIIENAREWLVRPSLGGRWVPART